MPIPKGASKQDIIHQVMSEFKHGKLRGGVGKHPLVKDRKQAVAIAMSQSGQTKTKHCKREYCEHCGKREKVTIGPEKTTCDNCGHSVISPSIHEKGDMYDSPFEAPHTKL